MRRIPLLLAALALCAVGLVACGGDDKPTKVKGSGYTFEAPAGWDDVTGDASEIADALSANGAEITAEDIGANYDAIVIAGDDSDGFHTNFNVTLQHDVPSALSAETIARQSGAILADPEKAAQFLPDGFTIDYDGGPPTKTTLGGEEAYELSYDATVSGNDLKASQIYVVHGGTAYVATFTASAGVFSADQADFKSIQKSWKFT